MSKEAMKLALEALGLLVEERSSEAMDDGYKAIKALEEALAKQEQSEPVAWELGAEVYWGNSPEMSDYVRKEGTPLYTTPQPPQRKPLTDEEIGAILEGVNAYGTRLYTFARAIEAAHGIKE